MPIATKSEILRKLIAESGFTVEPGTCEDSFENGSKKLLHIPDPAKADESNWIYYTCLHEIGHANTEKQAHLGREDYFFSNSGLGVTQAMGECEALAWRWAFANDPYKDKEGYAECFAALAGYASDLMDEPGPILTHMLAEAKAKRGSLRWSMDTVLPMLQEKGLAGNLPSVV
jgi:hypothetical protein